MKKIGLICSNTQAKQISDMLNFSNVEILRLDNAKKSKISRLIQLFLDILKVNLLYLGHGTGAFPYAAVIARLFRKKVIIHWIGSDVLDYKKSKFKSLIKKTATLHLACSDFISSELKELDIQASVVPIVPSEMNFNLSSAQKKHAALLYLPTGREEFYGIKYLNYLSEKYNNLNFYVVGNEKYIFNQKNIHNLGKISTEEMNNVYDKISILIRIPEHDGLSLMLLEALMRGKQVLYCYDFPYTHKVTNFIEADNAMKEILSSSPKPNIDGRNFVVENFSLEQSKKKIQKIFSDNNVI